MTVVECAGVGVQFSRGTLRSRASARVRRALGLSSAGHEADQRFWALRDVSFTVEEGSCLGVVGVNGSGKTTLLRALSGVYEPDEGHAWLAGSVASLLSLGAGMSPVLSGRDNIYLSGAVQSLGRREISELFQEICDFAELDEAAIATPIRYYSAGMRARLSFAISAVIEPDVLLIDEVLSVGDAGFRKKSSERLRELTLKARCVVVTSHELGFLKRHCDRFLWLHHGRVMDDGGAEVMDEYEAFVTA